MTKSNEVENILLLNPFDVYQTNGWISSICSLMIYVLLIHWTIRFYLNRCYPKFIGIALIFVHFLSFIEFILRSTLNRDELSSKWIYLLRFALINVPFRLILFSQFHFLVELRRKGEIRRRDRLIDLFVPLVATLADIFFGIANEILFRSPTSTNSFFFLRCFSSLILLILTNLFFFILFVDRIRLNGKRIFLFLFLSNSMISFQLSMIFLQSNIFFWNLFEENEFYFHLSETFPLLVCLILWNVHHPSSIFSSSMEEEFSSS